MTALKDKYLFALTLTADTPLLLCKNPINLVSVSEQDKKHLAAGYALAEIRKDFVRSRYDFYLPMAI